MDQSQSARPMSTTEIDLESVLQVRRRRLSTTNSPTPHDFHRFADVVFLKIDRSIDLVKEDGRTIFHGDYHIIVDIFQKFTANIKIHNGDPDSVKNHDRLSGKVYVTLEMPNLSLIEILEILLKHNFTIAAHSTLFRETNKLEEFVFTRCRETHETFARTNHPAETKPH